MTTRDFALDERAYRAQRLRQIHLEQAFFRRCDAIKRRRALKARVIAFLTNFINKVL